MVLVVFLHSYNITVKFTTGALNTHSEINYVLQELISNGFTRIAVPVFFIISGYLFFINFKNSPGDYFNKCQKRFRTLLIPYLFWSSFTILFYFVLQLIPQFSTFFTNELIKNYSANKLITTLLINPIPYQLWFLRNLIVFVIVSPIFFFFVRYVKVYSLIIVLILWFLDALVWFITFESIFFFLIGAYLGVQKNDLDTIKYVKKNYSWILLIVWVILNILKVLLSVHNFYPVAVNVLHKVNILVGLCTVWLLYDKFFYNVDLSKSKLLHICNYTFFFYLTHEPVLTIIKKVLFVFGGNSAVSFITIYFAAPVITICFCILTGKVLRKITPGIYYIIAGGR